MSDDSFLPGFGNRADKMPNMTERTSKQARLRFWKNSLGQPWEEEQPLEDSYQTKYFLCVGLARVQVRGGRSFIMKG